MTDPTKRKTNMKLLRHFLVIASLAFALPVVPLTFVGCQQGVMTLEPGGAYTDPVLAKTDRAILDASKLLTDFVAWAASNSAYLAKWPEVGMLAARISAYEKGWFRDAYLARDAYAEAAKAYRFGATPKTNVDSKRAALDGAMGVVENITKQIIAYRASH